MAFLVRPRALVTAFACCAVMGAAGCQGQIDRVGGAAADEDDSSGRGGVGGDGGMGGGGDVGGGSGTPSSTCRSGALPPVPARLWLLSDSQYVNTVRDVLGVTVAPDVTAPRPPGKGPLTLSDQSLVTGQSAFRYKEAAAEIARDATSALDRLVTCPGTRDERCAESFIRARVARLFRRPMLDAEVTSLMTVYRAGAGGGFAAGLALVLEAALQAPSFLYRSEVGRGASVAGRVTLDPHELAAAVSYFLIDSSPDDALWSRAEDGSLASPTVLAAEVERLLATPRVRLNLAGLAYDWLGISRVEGAVKDPKVFPSFSAAVRGSLLRSASRLVDEALWTGTFRDLLATSRMYVDGSLASLYDAPGVSGADLVAVEGLEGRAGGLITHPAWLASLAKADRTDVVHRGLFVHQELVCGAAVPPPPPEVQGQIAASAGIEDERARARTRADDPLCSACHAVFDPYGLALEGFDAIGRVRPDADGRATIVGLGGDADGPIAGGDQLAERLLKSGRVWPCATAKVGRHALGDVLATEAGACALESVTERFARTQDFRALIADIVTDGSFAVRAIP